MFCPVCAQTTLLMTERQGVEIDYCPKCRGVWLDRGELDKLIALATPRDDSGTTRDDAPRSARTAYDRERNENEFRSEREYRPEVERPYPSDRDRYEHRHPECHKPTGAPDSLDVALC
jgi:Zn-finger nucleic acid-binding protein